MAESTGWGIEVRWSREFGWVFLTDPATGEEHEIEAAALPWTRRRAMDTKERLKREKGQKRETLQAELLALLGEEEH